MILHTCNECNNAWRSIHERSTCPRCQLVTPGPTAAQRGDEPGPAVGDDRMGRVLCAKWAESARKHSPTGETPPAWVGGIVPWDQLTPRERAIACEVADAMGTTCFGCGYSRDSCRASWAAPDGGGCSGDWPGLRAERAAAAAAAAAERLGLKHPNLEATRTADGWRLRDVPAELRRTSERLASDKESARGISFGLCVEPTCEGTVYGFPIDKGKRWLVAVPSLAGVVAVADRLEDATAKVWQMAQDQHGVMMRIDWGSDKARLRRIPNRGTLEGSALDNLLACEVSNLRHGGKGNTCESVGYPNPCDPCRGLAEYRTLIFERAEALDRCDRLLELDSKAEAHVGRLLAELEEAKRLISDMALRHRTMSVMSAPTCTCHVTSLVPTTCPVHERDRPPKCHHGNAGGCTPCINDALVIELSGKLEEAKRLISDMVLRHHTELTSAKDEVSGLAESELSLTVALTEHMEPEVARLDGEVDRMKQWVNDLQSGCFINCVYCGHRFGPNPGTPVAMADVLREHIEQCPDHPLSKALAEVERVKSVCHELVVDEDEWQERTGGNRTAIEVWEDWEKLRRLLSRVPNIVMEIHADGLGDDGIDATVVQLVGRILSEMGEDEPRCAECDVVKLYQLHPPELTARGCEHEHLEGNGFGRRCTQDDGPAPEWCPKRKR